MATNIGPKIGIDGEKQYRDEINKIIQQAKTLDAQMKLVTASFDKNTTAEEKAEATSKLLGEQIDNAQKKVEALADMVAKAEKETGENSKTTLAWKEALYNAQKELVDLQSNTEEAAEETEGLAEEMDDGGKSALSFGDIIKANVISDAVISGFKALAGAAKSAVKAISEGFTDSVQWADDLATLSTNTGVSTKRLQEFEYMAGLIDTDVSTITSALAKNTKAMTSAANATENANGELNAVGEAYRALGVEIKNEDGSLRDSETVFFELIDALGKVSDQTTRDSLSMTILGKSAQDLNSMIAAGGDRMAELADEADNLGYVLDEEALEGLLDTSDAMDRLKATGNGLKRNLSSTFAPFVADIAEKVIPGIQETAQELGGVFSGEISASEFIEKLSGKITTVLESITARLPEILQTAGTLVTTLAEGIIQQAPQLIETALPIVLTLIQGLVGMLPQITEQAVQIIVVLAQGLAQAAPTLIPAITQAITGMLLALTEPDTLIKLLDAGIQLVVGIIEGLLDATPQLVDAAIQLIGNLITVLTSPEFYENLGKAILELGKKIVEKLGGIAETVKQGFEDNVVKPFKEKIEAAKDWGKDLIKNFVDGIKSKFESLKEGVKKAAETVKDFLGFSEPKKGPLSDFHTYAPDMIDLFVKGIRAGEGKIGSTLSDAFGQLPENGFSLPAYGRQPLAAAAGGGNRSYNLGGVNFTINARDGQSAREIAEEAIGMLQDMIEGDDSYR